MVQAQGVRTTGTESVCRMPWRLRSHAVVNRVLLCALCAGWIQSPGLTLYQLLRLCRCIFEAPPLFLKWYLKTFLKQNFTSQTKARRGCSGRGGRPHDTLQPSLAFPPVLASSCQNPRKPDNPLPEVTWPERRCPLTAQK